MLSLLVTINLSIYSQGIKPQNVYRVTVTSRYVVEEGERTSTFYAVNQEISDSLGRLHTEIDYNWETRYPDNYRWHYYDSMELVRTDYFIDEKLDVRKVFEREKQDRIVRELHFMPGNEDTVMVKSLDFTYNSDGFPERIDASNSSGRRLYRVRSRFDEHGTEIRRRVRGRRGEPDDGIIRLDREAGYDSLGYLTSESVQLRMADGSRTQYTKKYQYDEHGNITGMTELDGQGNQVSRIEYVWQPNRNRLSRIQYYDHSDQLEKYMAKRYEIYRTNDRRQRVIDY